MNKRTTGARAIAPMLVLAAMIALPHAGAQQDSEGWRSRLPEDLLGRLRDSEEAEARREPTILSRDLHNFAHWRVAHPNVDSGVVLDVLKVLLDAGADPNARHLCPERQSILHHFIVAGDRAAFRLLRERGADLDFEEFDRVSPR